MNQNTKLAVLKAGIVPEGAVKEFTRWGLEVPEDVPVEPDRRAALAGIREAIEGPETVALRITHLDALHDYEKNAQAGRLYYSLRGGRGNLKRTTFVDITFCRNAVGNYLIPWTDEDIYDLMLDENTYLKPMGGERVYFSDVAYLYYGEQKTFMVCIPVTEDP